jgi:hypothetical protein
VVSSVLFDLDAPFASQLFVWNSLLFLVGILPLLLLCQGLFLSLPL